MDEVNGPPIEVIWAELDRDILDSLLSMKDDDAETIKRKASAIVQIGPAAAGALGLAVSDPRLVAVRGLVLGLLGALGPDGRKLFALALMDLLIDNPDPDARDDALTAMEIFRRFYQGKGNPPPTAESSSQSTPENTKQKI